MSRNPTSTQKLQGLLASIRPRLKLMLLSVTLSAASCAFAYEPALEVTFNEGEYTIPLGFITGSGDPIELRGASAEQLVSVPISPRFKIGAAQLDVIYTNSISLIPRSQLAVTLDKRVLAQFPIRASQPDNAARLSLPVDHLFPGYRSLGFRAAQHYTNDCEDSAAPELYSQVDARRSVLRIKAERRAVQPSLARLDEVFDKRLWKNNFNLNILSAEPYVSPGLLDAASLLAQGAALRLEFLPTQVVFANAQRVENALPTNAQANLPGLRLPPGDGDVILIGTRAALAPYLADSLIQRINGGYIGIFPADSDPTRAVLIVSGTDMAQIKQAATVLAMRQLALPDRKDVNIADLKMPEGFQRPVTNECAEPNCIKFASLKFKNTTMRGLYPKPVNLNFWAFPEMFGPQQLTFNAQINYAYGAGFDKKSALNVMLNGQFIQAFHLGDIAGEQVRGAKLKVPVAALQQGRNVLSFVPTVIGQDVGGQCVPIFTEHLFVSILNDSSIELPKMDGFMRLPDLNLFSRAVLPYTLKNDAHGTSLLLLGQDPATISSALTLMGKLAQVNESALSGIKTITDQSKVDSNQDLIVVGAANELTASFRNQVSAFLPKVRWQSNQIGVTSAGIQSGLLEWLQNPLEPAIRSIEQSPVNAVVSLSEGLGQSSAAVQFQSESNKKTITLFTAADSQQLQMGLERLIRFTTWAELQGNGMLWDASGNSIGLSYPSDHYLLGNAPQRSTLSLLFADRQWLAVGIALLVIFGLSLLTWLILRRRAARMGTQ